MDFFEPCKYFKGLNLINIKETGRTEGQKCKEKRKSLSFSTPLALLLLVISTDLKNITDLSWHALSKKKKTNKLSR